MSLNILSKINYGYDHLEPVIMGLMAMNKNFMLIGRHGTGKSRIAKFLSKGYGKTGYVFYDATKDDLISIAGIPNPQAIKAGHLSFTAHQRSIWDKSTVVVDEITRAGKENQNLWLEILEERSCFGMPLSYRTLIATANPESYAAAFKLDDALLDRFYAILPVPEMQDEMDTADIEAITRLAFNNEGKISAEAIARTFSEIQQEYSDLVDNGGAEKVMRYCSQLMSGILSAQKLKPQSDRIYISARTYSRILPETILAVAAYYRVAGKVDPLIAGAEEAIRYCLHTKLKIEEGLLMQLHGGAKELLEEGEISEAMKLRFALATKRSFEDRIEYLKENMEIIKEHLAADEMEKFLGELLRGASQEGEKEKLVHLKKVLDDMDYQGDILRQVDGNLILTLNSAINTIIPILNNLPVKPSGKTTRAWENIQAFKQLVAHGKLTGLQSDDAVKLKMFIIDVYEEDESTDDDNLIGFFSSIDLRS